MPDPVPPTEGARRPLAESLPEDTARPAEPPPRPRPKERPPAPTAAVRLEADRRVRDANLLRMRGQLADAERELQQALAMAPGDAAAWELLGDVQRQAGRNADALESFNRALDLQLAPGSRATLEAKMARMAIERSPKATARAGGGGPLQGNPAVTVVFSVVVPGLGQMLSGQPIKGAILCAVWLITVVVIVMSPTTQQVMGNLSSEMRGRPVAPAGAEMGLLALLLLNLGAWLYSVIDSVAAARRALEGTK